MIPTDLYRLTNPLIVGRRGRLLLFLVPGILAAAGCVGGRSQKAVVAPGFVVVRGETIHQPQYLVSLVHGLVKIEGKKRCVPHGDTAPKFSSEERRGRLDTVQRRTLRFRITHDTDVHLSGPQVI